MATATSPEKRSQLTPVDAYRVLLGRDPEFGTDSLEHQALSSMSAETMLAGIIRSPEFLERWGLGTLLPLPDLTVMAEAAGLRYWFHLRDRQIGQCIAAGRYEPRISAIVRRFVGPGMTVLDVGANLGYFSVLMASLGATVHAFEPFAANAHLLARNANENGLAIDIHRVAAHRENRRGWLYYRDDSMNDNHGSMFASSEPHSGLACVEVEYARIDDLVKAGRIGFVKMDVEGSEIEALEGMARIIRRDRPPLVIELNEYSLRLAGGRRPEDLLAAIQSYGYRIMDADTEKPYHLDKQRAVLAMANLLCV